MKRNYFYKVDDPNQLEKIKFCPYCGSDNMYVFLGDWHNYTVCFECEDELEFMAVMEGAGRMTKAECGWYLEDYNFSQWESDCGLTWYMSNDETPKENEMNYCPKCGKELVEEEKMNKSHRKKIRTMYAIGVEISEIARVFRITENDVLRICKGATRGRI